MELLSVKNFLTIKSGQLDIKPFTLLIGPQANGKSVIAKLVYFFREFLFEDFLDAAQKTQSKWDLQKQAIFKFEQLFPKYTWADQDFSIDYSIDDIKISLVWQGKSSKKSSFQITLSENLVLLYQRLRKTYKARLDQVLRLDEDELKNESLIGQRDLQYKRYEVISDVSRELVFDVPIGHSFQRSVFVPASRSFFATLQKNVFSFLANNIPIDPLIKEFGSMYEISKAEFTSRANLASRNKNQEYVKLKEEIVRDMEEILLGTYLYEDEQDWIVTNKKRLNLANASSGQQESLPLLVVLVRSARFNSKVRPYTYFIEEPEAHLFPTAQKRLVEIFIRLHTIRGHSFFLTTHSPYILTALNNMILASNVIQQKGDSSTEAVRAITGGNVGVGFGDVNAYTIRNGVVENIMDHETQLIGSTIIDSVSDDFDCVFDKLMELQFAK